MIRILAEPKGEVYRALIDLAFSVCSEFVLVDRHQFELNDHGVKILELLKSELIDIEVDEKWPGTELSGHFANIYYFKTSDAAKKVLLDHSDALYSWLNPNYPEDLIFYKTKGEVWLLSTTHDETCRIYVDNEKEMLNVLQGFGIDCKIG